MSDAEVILIMIMFHMGGYRCLKHYYLNHICTHCRYLFPNVVSYNRFVELEMEVMLEMGMFVKFCLLAECTGISFVDSTPLRMCKNQRIHIHKTFAGYAERGAKKNTQISPRAAMRVCKAILTHLRNAQRFLSCKKHLPETTKKKAVEPVSASDTDLIDEKRRLPVGTIQKTTAARQLGNNCCFV